MHCGTAVAFAERKIIIVDDVSFDEKRMSEKYRRMFEEYEIPAY